MALNSITDYSRTQRIVLLIDLNPLLSLPNPTLYLKSLFSSAKILLSFPSLSQSLFSFRLFFSSFSPLLSSFKLPNTSLSLSFNLPTPTLQSLSDTLNSMQEKLNFSSAAALPKASNVAASMSQIVHDYAWDQVGCDSITGTLPNFDSTYVRSNLVVLLSPIFRNKKWVSEFFYVQSDDELLTNVDVFCEKFRGVFESVNDAFVSRDIHFSWVDVKYEVECSEEKVEVGTDGSELGFGLFESAVKSLGWGFCSTDLIILGSALIPFGLIYPKIGILSKFFDLNDSCKSIRSHLNLEILDVSGKSLEYKCSDLELIDVEMSGQNRFSDFLHTKEFVNSHTVGHELRNKFWEGFGNGIAKIHVKAVKRYDEGVKIKGHLSDPIFMREFSGECGKDLKEGSDDFLAVRVLEMLARETGEFVQRKSVPIWQILLSFLYREGYWALVSLSNGNGDSCMGILKPFTASSALLSIIYNEDNPHNSVSDSGGSNLARFVTKIDNKTSQPDTDMNHIKGFFVTQFGTSSPRKFDVLGDDKRKKSKRNSHLLQNLTWSTFQKAAFEHSEVKLEDVYFARGCSNTKKLKFFKCWMKQIKKPSCCSEVTPAESMLHQDVPKEMDNRLTELYQDSEQPICSSASVGENSLTGASRVLDEAAPTLCSETAEAFFSNLSHKILQGLEPGVELGALAERLVNSSINWLYKKCDVETTPMSPSPVVNSDDARGSVIAVELTKLLLREPKDLVEKHKNNDSLISEVVVREYELQILFRMEILRSEVAASIGESKKQKFVKQICLLLENIQCHMEGGFFGDWSLDNYVGKIIKTRYSDVLGDVVHRIYKKMDLLMFPDEDESLNPQLNSEDLNQSWGDKLERNETGNIVINKSVSAEEKLLQPLKHDNLSPQGIRGEEHARKLIEAQERRQRARRFASSTSWVPDLQRVWAPKQPKTLKAKSDYIRKLSKGKDRGRASCDRVRETPMTGNKRSCLRCSSIDDEDHQDPGMQSTGSVSKALFQDHQ